MGLPWISKISATLVVLGLVWSGHLHARSYGPHTGYTAKVEREREEMVQDIIIFTPPAPDKPPLKDRLYDEKMTNEITERYRQKFGYTEQQRAYLAPNSHTYYNDMYTYSGTALQADSERRRFGEFIVRRLGEHHFDKMFRDDPKFNSVYVAKQNITNSSATVSRKVKFKGKYHISSNTATVEVQNPWVDTRVTIEMDDSREAVISLSRQLTQTVRGETHFKKVDGIATVVGSKAFTPLLSTTLSVSTFTNRTGTSARASVYLAGVNWTY